MPNIVIRVTGVSLANPATSTPVDYDIFVENGTTYGGNTLYVSFGITAEAFNEAIVADAVSVCAGHSVTVSTADTKRLIGGAHPRLV